MSAVPYIALLLSFLVACSSPEDTASSLPVSAPPAQEFTGSHQDSPAAGALANTAEKVPGTILIGADPWCPHNCTAGSSHEGYMVDLVREVLEAEGYQVEYINISWARALRLTREGKLDAVVGAFRTDAPDFVFPRVPQGRSLISFYTHPDNQWTWKGIDSLEGQALMGINSYSYSPALDRYINRHEGDAGKVWILSGPAPLARAVELLERKRMDVFVGDGHVMGWFLNTDKPEFKPRLAGILSTIPAYVAFSPTRTDAGNLAALVSNGTERLTESGRLKEILARYGLKEPE